MMCFKEVADLMRNMAAACGTCLYRRGLVYRSLYIAWFLSSCRGKVGLWVLTQSRPCAAVVTENAAKCRVTRAEEANGERVALHLKGSGFQLHGSVEASALCRANQRCETCAVMLQT